MHCFSLWISSTHKIYTAMCIKTHLENVWSVSAEAQSGLQAVIEKIDVRMTGMTNMQLLLLNFPFKKTQFIKISMHHSFNRIPKSRIN